ncbi:MAG TPA: phage tail protein [Allosphingosinicella sp.]|nr:phage tail protein [Allosphingosinicella sp.]
MASAPPRTPIPIPDDQDQYFPFGSFNFHVSFVPVQGGSFAAFGSSQPGFLGAFSDISGIEATMEHKVIKTGGRNYGTPVRAGPVTFGTVILKRGIVQAQPLWTWWSMFAGADGFSDGVPSPANRCHVAIALIRPVQAGQSRSAALGWRLVNAMPVKFRVGDLNAKGGEVAVEEIHLVHEGLEMAGVGA